MPYLKNYLDKIIERGNVGLAESISNTAEEVGNNYLKNFSFTSHEIGLLLGNVQSGKTGQMFGIMSKATDLGFPVFVLLTTDNIVLQQQTLDRVKADLDGFCICGENDAESDSDTAFDKSQLMYQAALTVEAEESNETYRVHELMNEMTDKQREVLVLTEFEGYSLTEVSKRIGISIKNVKKHHDNAMNYIKENFFK